MALLGIGVLLWSASHLFPSVLPNTRAAVIGRIGDNAYRGMFSLVVLAGLVLIVIGWRSADVSLHYRPPLFGSPIVTGLMYASFALLAAANMPGNTKRIIRHPMLTGVIVWSIAHLLANGDSRSVVLFGGLGIWALLSIILINRRDRDWERPEPVSFAKDLMTLAGSAVVFAIVIFLHPYLFGVSALPGF